MLTKRKTVAVCQQSVLGRGENGTLNLLLMPEEFSNQHIIEKAHVHSTFLFDSGRT